MVVNITVEIAATIASDIVAIISFLGCLIERPPDEWDQTPGGYGSSVEGHMIAVMRGIRLR
jgi:hypothetical protein